jgi:hypothetical protein
MVGCEHFGGQAASNFKSHMFFKCLAQGIDSKFCVTNQKDEDLLEDLSDKTITGL